MGAETLIARALDARRLTFVVIGSVDDGKSTLIGRLLHDANGIHEDQLRSVRRASRSRGGMDLSLVTDGLRAERQQGITIDVAYRYFSTAARRFVIADAPGHEQYTRNMVSAASIADLAVILVDATQGVLTQSRRHAFISSLLGVRHIVVAVNKMDLAGYSRAAFDKVERAFGEFAAKLGVHDLTYIPVSALKGDNVVRKSRRMPWHQGPPLLSHLETVYVAGDTNLIDLRFAVQSVVRPQGGGRLYAGRALSGVVRVGDDVMALPSGRTTRVTGINTFDGNLDYAFPPREVTLALADEMDLGRGDMLVHPANLPRVTREVEALVVWLCGRPLDTARTYYVKHTTNNTRGEFGGVDYVIDPDSLHRHRATKLSQNEVGRAFLRLYRPIMCDEYARNKRTGSFIVVDSETNETAGAGIIIERARHRGPTTRPPERSQSPSDAAGSRVSPADRRAVLGQESAVVWLTGLSGSGKSSIAYGLEERLTRAGHPCFVLDGDKVRQGLNSDLGFSPDDRRENIRRISEVSRLFADAGLIAITSFISPYRVDRDAARSTTGVERFVEVFVDAPLEVCEARDSKGLYRKARAGEIAEFTGVSAPYEAPQSPELHLRTDRQSVEECVDAVMEFLRSRGHIGASRSH